MSRTGKYLKPSLGGHSPACLIGLVVDALPSPHVPEGCTAVPASFSAAHVCFTRRSHNKWTDPQYLRFEVAGHFWQWLERWAYPNRRAHVFAPLASDCLTLLGFFKRVDRLGGRFRGQLVTPVRPGVHPSAQAAFVFKRLVLRGKPDIVEYSVNQRNYTWLSLTQYLPLTDHELDGIRACGGATSSPGSTRGPSDSFTSRERCTLYCDTARRLGSWWESLSAGGFGRTIGQMSLSFLRSRVSAKAVSTHTDERAIKLERAACHGGRASTWYYGDCTHRSHVQPPDATPPPARGRWHRDEKLYHIDVRSMYPWLMTVIDTPTKLVSVTYDVSPAGLLGIMRGMTAVASVSLDTPAAEYPHRLKENVVYPVGRFGAVLCGVELRRALAEGHVVSVHCACIYSRGRPFAAAAAELLTMRDEARSRGDAGWEAFCKLLANSLTGKLAQRSAVWCERPKTAAEVEWGEWLNCDMGGGAPRRFRALAGMVWELVRDKPGVGTMTACYAHITSAGRDVMRTLREELPHRSVVSQDTDGLWVTGDAVRHLRASNRLAGERPGELRVTAESTASRFFSPKHYYAAGRWTLSGLHMPHTSATDLTFYDTYTSNLARSSSDKPPETIHLHTREVTLSTLPHDGEVGGDGWQVPLRLPLLPRSRMPESERPAPSDQRELPFDL